MWPFFVITDEYKARKEAFVFGHVGSSLTDVLLCLYTVPIGILTLRLLLSFVCANAKLPHPTTWSRTSRFVVEFLCLALPPLLCMTIAADAVPLVLGVQFAVCLLLHVASLITQSVPLLSVHLSPWHASHLLAAERRKSFVSSYRSGIMLCTWIAILAVDFVVFPRRMAKTETFGTSLMDMGVGCCVFCSALVSRQTRRTFGCDAEEQANHTNSTSTRSVDGGATGAHGARQRKSRGQSSMPAPIEPPSVHAVGATKRRCAALESMRFSSLCVSQVNAFVSSMLGAAPLLLMGIARIIVHTAVNYPTHDSEYGVHWSFPFSASLVALLATLLETVWNVLMWAAARFRGPGARSFLHFSTNNTCRAWVYLMLSALVGVLYQTALRSHAALAFAEPGSAPDMTLEAYILTAERVRGSFFAQNREGLSGLWGYFSIFLAGLGIGRMLLAPGRTAALLWRTFFVRMCMLAAGLWAGMWLALHTYGAVSRRLVNLPYVAWVVAFNLTMMLAVMCIELVTNIFTRPQDAVAYRKYAASVPAPAPASTPPSAADVPRLPSPAVALLDKPWSLTAFTPNLPTWLMSACAAIPPLHAALVYIQRSVFGAPPLEQVVAVCGSVLCDAINFNFLALFIASNLLVGIPNHTLPTIDIADAPAMVILVLYLAAASGIAFTWRVWRLHLKIW